MKKAFNINNNMIDILESNKEENYFCPICNEKLTRNFGKKNSHPM